MKAVLNSKTIRKKNAQAAIEYLLLLGATVVVVLWAFKTLLSKHQQEAEGYFNYVARGVYGPPTVYNDTTTGTTVDRLREGGVYP